MTNFNKQDNASFMNDRNLSLPKISKISKGNVNGVALQN